VDDQLGRAAADVEDERRGRGLDAVAGELRLFVAADEPGREAVAPLDLAEECFAVLGVTDSTCSNRERPLGAEGLDRPTIVGEDIAYARDRTGEETATCVDALAESGDARLAMQFLYAPFDD